RPAIRERSGSARDDRRVAERLCGALEPRLRLELLEGAARLDEQRLGAGGAGLPGEPLAVFEQCDCDVERHRQLTEERGCSTQRRFDRISLAAPVRELSCEPGLVRLQKRRSIEGRETLPLAEQLRNTIEIVEREGGLDGVD